MSECTHDCSTCGEACAERDPKSFLEKQNDASNIRHMVGIVSGKGGVGKSFMTGLLACGMSDAGKKTAILDADITGPSIPFQFGLKDKKAESDGTFLHPVETEKGIKVMSMNLLLPNSTDPVVWRGPVVAGAIKQFYTDVAWGDVDYMLVDMPPGTSDVPLTAFQSLPLDGIIIVTTPQDLVSMIVEKAVNMARLMNVPILGLIENMAYFECPDCGGRFGIFGPSHVEAISEDLHIETFAKVPVNYQVTRFCDLGAIEHIDPSVLRPIIQKLLTLPDKE